MLLFGGWDARALARATCYFSKHVRWLLVLAGVIIGGSPYLAGAENGGNRSVPAIFGSRQIPAPASYDSRQNQQAPYVLTKVARRARELARIPTAK